SSDFNLFGDGERVINLDSEISDGTSHPCVAKQKLDRAQIAGAAVDQGGLRATERVSAEHVWVKLNTGNSFPDKPSILPGRHGFAGPAPAGEKKLTWGLPEIEFSVSMAILISWEKAMMRRSAWRTGFTVAWARHGSGRIPGDFTGRLLNGRIGNVASITR